MDDQKAGLRGDGELDGGKGGVHGGGDFADDAGVFNLEAVDGAVPVSEEAGAEALVAMADDGGEGGLAHEADENRSGGIFQTRNESFLKGVLNFAAGFL
jgi:hypothetical protein